MSKRPPSAVRLLIAIGFAISCFGLTLFLWLAFGGPVPLQAEGYRFQVPFDEATQLASESDVRISGVSVGKVKSVELEDSHALATIEMEPRYSPIPSDTRATLRAKTLLGETYVELTPGSEQASDLPEGGELEQAQVAESVQLDELLRTFDPETRAAFQRWMQGQAAAVSGRGDDLSAAIASLDPFAAEADRLLRLLSSQELAVQGLVSNSADVFESLSERQGQLRGLIESSDRVFATTAARDRELAEVFRIFPTFLRESRATVVRLDRFAANADPLVQQLRPAARELSPTLVDLGRLAPELEAFLLGLRRAIGAADPGFPALRELLDDELPPLLSRLDPFLAELNPIVEGARLYRRELAAFLANTTAATQGGLGRDLQGNLLHYVHTETVLSPEAMAFFERRLRTNRTNPYVRPGGYLELMRGLASFDTRHCTTGVDATLDPTTPQNPNFNQRTEGDVAAAEDLFQRIRNFSFDGGLSTTGVPAPPCRQQRDFRSLGGPPRERTTYQHTRPER